MSGKQIVMLKARLKSKDFCILIKGKPCFTDWPSKGDSKVINVLILALCQSESDARQLHWVKQTKARIALQMTMSKVS